MSKIKTILVTGKQGQLGRSVQDLVNLYPQYQFTFTGREQLDLTCSEAIDHFFHTRRFDCIINCAAYTAVDRAEQDAELADRVNHKAVQQLAQTALNLDMRLIHISTDYVFDGTACQPYTEDIIVNPQNQYGLSKLKGEMAIKTINSDTVIIRTGWVYSEYGHNFVKTMLKLGQQREQLNVVFDQIGSPTYAFDLAVSIMTIIDHFNQQQANRVSVYHYSNEGVCSWYDFAQAIFELASVDCLLQPIEAKHYPTPAKRPFYSVLNKAKIKQVYQLDIPYWRDSLRTCLKRLNQYAI